MVCYKNEINNEHYLSLKMELTVISTDKYVDLCVRDPNFVRKMNETLKEGKVPDYVPPALLLHWAQLTKTSFTLSKNLPGTVLRKWQYTASYDSQSNELSYESWVNGSVKCQLPRDYNLLWISLVELNCEHIWYKKPNVELDSKFVSLLDSALAKYKYEYSITDYRHDILLSDSLYHKGKAHVQIKVNIDDVCEVINKTKPPSLKGWYSRVNIPSHFLIYNYGRWKLKYTSCMYIYTSIYFYEIRDHVWQRYVGPKLTIFEEYKNGNPSIGQLRKWANDEWQTKGRTREDIISEVEKKIYKGDWLR